MESIEQLKGQVYGQLTIVDEASPYISPKGEKSRQVLCQCSCGKYITVVLSTLKHGKPKTCNDSLHRIDMSLVGQRFGRLVVKEFDHLEKNRGSYWKCQCDCGNKKIILRTDLLNHHTISCGCYAKENMQKRSYKHGLSNARIHRIWNGMKQRCSNPNCHNYKNYGGRGIQVCKEWQTFITFYDWAINNGYNDQLSIERIDVNGNYEPDNCTWIPVSQQLSNKRNNVFFTYNGETYTIEQWSKKLNICRQVLSRHIKKNNYQDFIKYFQSTGA